MARAAIVITTTILGENACFIMAKTSEIQINNKTQCQTTFAAAAPHFLSFKFIGLTTLNNSRTCCTEFY